MIEDFQFITENLTVIKPTINADDAPYFPSDDIRRQFTNSLSRGFSWTYNGKEQRMFETGTRFLGIPSPDMKFVIVIYPVNHKKFPAPHNAIIYNGNGSIHKKLNVPAPISPQAKEMESRLKSTKHDELYFDTVYWTRVADNRISAAVVIGFDHEWTERRLLNPETGEFGDCITSSRL